MRKISILIIMLVLTSGFGYSQNKVWTLAECVKYARDNNISIKSSLVDVEIARQRKEQSKLDFLPSVGANLGYNIYTGRALDPTTYEYLNNQTVQNVNVGGSVSTPIIAGLQKQNNLKLTQSEYIASMHDHDRLKNDVSLNVAMYFLNILYNKELLITYRKQLESSDSNIAKMEQLVEAGAATRGALLELIAQRSNEDFSVVNGESQLKTSILDLCQLMQITDSENFDITAPPLPSLVDIFPRESIEQIYQAALVLPEIQGAEQRLNSAAYSIKIAQGRLYPSLNFNAGYSSAYSDSRRRPVLDDNGLPIITPDGIQYEKYRFFSQLKDNAGSSVSFGLSIPIFNSLSLRRNVRIARMNKIKAEYALEDQKQKLYKDVQKAYSDALSSMKKFDAARVKVESHQESIKYTESRFRTGAATITDYSVAKNNLIIAEAQMLQAKYDYIFKVKILDFYKGIPIEVGF